MLTVASLERAQFETNLVKGTLILVGEDKGYLGLLETSLVQTPLCC